MDDHMTLEQFQATLRNKEARRRANVLLTDDQVALVLADPEMLEMYFVRWQRDRTLAGTSAVAAPPVPVQTAPAGWYDVEGGLRRWWTGSEWGSYYSEAQALADPPGRTVGFVLGILAMVFVAAPFLALPLGIVGWVQSRKALRLLPVPTRGRGLAVAGLTLSIIAVSLTSLFMLLAIPGAWVRNFG